MHDNYIIVPILWLKYFLLMEEEHLPSFSLSYTFFKAPFSSPFITQPPQCTTSILQHTSTHPSSFTTHCSFKSFFKFHTFSPFPFDTFILYFHFTVYCV